LENSFKGNFIRPQQVFVFHRIQKPLERSGPPQHNF
jgi:hypothetical protein